jgi:peptidoglycan hydrolase CwlO-like protein
MKTENEKSIGQEALQEYANKQLDERYEGIGFIVGVIVAILSAIAFVFFVLNCKTCLHDQAMIAFCAIIIAAMTGMFGFGFFVLFSWSFRRDEKQTERIISLLSVEATNKIVSDYIQKELTSSQNNISYCEEKIQKLQLEIEKLLQSLEGSKQRITELQKKIK